MVILGPEKSAVLENMCGDTGLHLSGWKILREVDQRTCVSVQSFERFEPSSSLFRPVSPRGVPPARACTRRGGEALKRGEVAGRRAGADLRARRRVDARLRGGMRLGAPKGALQGLSISPVWSIRASNESHER